MKQCPKCNSSHTKPGTFCSRSCANSKTWSDEDKKKKSESAKNSAKVLAHNRKPRSKRKYVLGPHLPKLKKPTGGIRAGSGRSKSGYYNGIYCGSTYELVWVIYNIDNSISFTRCDQVFQYGENRKYFPDFKIDDTIIEIKGYDIPEVQIKAAAVLNAGFKIRILYKDDLKHCFDWVKASYSYKNLYELYDGFKPKYEYLCDHCGNIFPTETKRKIGNKYCSLTCRGYSLVDLNQKRKNLNESR